MSARVVKRFRTGAAMATFAAGLFRKALLAKRGRFSAALPGGRTPAGLFKELASMRLPWERVTFLMSDERLVPVSSPASNFGAARRALFSRINIPRSCLRRAASASRLEKEIRSAAGPAGGLDLVFLGLGADGHTASIFPGSPALQSPRLALAVTAPRGVKPARRLTMTLKTLNRSLAVVLMAAGPQKKAAFALAARGSAAVPAGRLKPGKLYLLFADKE